MDATPTEATPPHPTPADATVTVPELLTERLRLRAAHDEDVPDLIACPPLVASGGGPFAIPLVVATTALLAVPPALHARPAAFERAAATLAAALLPWPLIGSWVGMFAFLPSAPLLLLAAVADPRRRPRAAKFLAAAGLLLAVAVSLSWWNRGYQGDVRGVRSRMPAGVRAAGSRPSGLDSPRQRLQTHHTC
ncbi:hypothetical protein ACFWFZ_03055 [Streptomyces sp. NPDC060232]|uniref:hypothetical protein n=1 Tax=Streptomyces sp. NPDC060232 TaxID=3347079 RepID=UPI00365F6F89